MTMLREFFDITKDSGDIFDGLAIMGAEEALAQIKEKRYAEGLRAEASEGEILCLGIAHFKKKCSLRKEFL